MNPVSIIYLVGIIIFLIFTILLAVATIHVRNERIACQTNEHRFCPMITCPCDLPPSEGSEDTRLCKGYAYKIINSENYTCSYDPTIRLKR